ncbi:type II toxin-antitoxin system RelE/ParE family toxin [Rufibacter sp. LB8]|uniref:type II toxin-antitoxin system RelE/ParE family toxin n=1 Tax=Rufibacter sp. LB8 TaxID=2777781 RepID=UPI00178C7B2A|nr:type II toxin-antitoxin system RelE/ParE family toxin [Rufibacter sp. LB8]
MDLKVLWTYTATRQLEDIFDYYKTTASLPVARKLVKGLVRRTSALAKHPQLGQREPLLTERQKEYRYLVEGNYKIIYWVDPATVNVAAVFDTRQNPERIQRAE